MELKMSNLTKEFRDMTAVKNVSYTMTTGVYGLLGVNGAGKTTLMRMLCTLLKPTGGSITWDGEDIFEMDGKYRKILGYLPQDFGYYPDFTVYDYLMYIASIKGVRPAAARQRIKLLLDQVGMKKAAKRKMKKLSGGMKRRIGIAQAMLGDPKILILDEPTAGLDPNERIRFRNLISELAGERLVLLSTHIVSDIEAIADEVLLMKKGKVLIQGTVSELTKKAAGKVWELTVSPSEAKIWQEKAAVANLRHEGEQVVLRILSDVKPAEGAAHCEAGLEDLYLYSMREYPK